MVKEETIYTTTDGKQYKTKKSAQRHEHGLLMSQKGYTKKEVDEALPELAKTNRLIEVLLKGKPDWRDWNSHLVEQLSQQIENFKNDVVHYSIVKKGLWDKEPKVLVQTSEPRVSDEGIPTKLQDYIDNLTDTNKEGSTFKIEMYKEEPTRIKYKLVEVRLTPEEMLNKGIPLTESALQELVREYPNVYQEEGENRRWSQTMTTVVEVEDGTLYAIDWERGLTESQENQFYEQPRKVTLEQKEIVTIVTHINYL